MKHPCNSIEFSDPHRPLDTLRSLYKAGLGPSSSHTMGPMFACQQFKKLCQDKGLDMDRVRYKLTLYGSLAQTGIGHQTDTAIYRELTKEKTVIIWDDSRRLQHHSNGMLMQAHYDNDDKTILAEEIVFSVGGGSIEIHGMDKLVYVPIDYKDEMKTDTGERKDYFYAPLKNYHDFAVMCLEKRIMPHKLIYEFENKEVIKALENEHKDIAKVANSGSWTKLPKNIQDQLVQSYLMYILQVMLQAVDDGLKRTEDIVASAKVSYRRQAYRIHEKAQRVPEGTVKTSLLIKSYGIAVSEQNGSASGYVVTAPTCGSCGVMPAVMYHMREEKLKMARQMLHSDKVPKQIMDKINNELINALAVASYIGNICRANATVSGAEGGCQAEIGVAETMAAAAVCYDAMTTSFHKQKIKLNHLLNQVEFAATMCMKSRTGLICDPVDGVVIEPCIDRNGVIAVQAYHTGLMSAFEEYDAKETKHVDFDAIVAIMHETALDMNMKYRESSMGGCALAWEINRDRKNNYAQNQRGDIDLEELAQ